jgi:hypothetical protein
MRRQRSKALIVLLAACAVAAPAAAAPRFEPRAHHDPADARNGSLDLRAAAFGQVGTQLSLRLRTRRKWSGGPLCVTLRRQGRLCIVAGRSGSPTVRFRGSRVRGADVEQSGRTLRALVYPRALGLRPGRFAWFARGRGDRLPDSGTARLRVSVYGAPRCFGAAARAEEPCENAALERLVTPRPRDAELMPDLPCQAHKRKREYKVLRPCLFGDRYGSGRTRLVLIGDSHAMSLRATVEVAAQALEWKAVAFHQASCPFTTETTPGWPAVPKRCRRHSNHIVKWLRSHPSVRDVVMTAAATDRYTEAGYRKMLGRIPDSVERVYVVRDIPRVTFRTHGCVESVRKRGAVSAGACPVPRSKALPHDPAAAAAEQSGPRVHLVDLTPHFCSDSECFPVIGGAYAYRDTNHMNSVFAGTLGPYLLRAMRAQAPT